MKIDISGKGAEVVIGKLSEKQTQKIFTLLSKKKDGIDEDEFETIMEKPWNEVDNILHWHGAWGGKYGFYLTNEKEEEIKPEGLLNFNFDDDDCFTNNSKDGVDNYHVGINKFNPYIHKMFLSGRSKDVTDEMKKFAENSGVIFMCVSEEKGHWGSFELKDNFDVKKLVPKIACIDIGLYSECLYGFLYDGKEVEIEFTGDTVGKSRVFYLIEPTFNDDDGLITYDIAKDWYM
ncbi:hypothetical protein OAI70_00165 [Candidatus Pelagibacter sp.]|nr:hypothetical protein [Candidatus Pelagibacter sp.]